MPKRVRKRTRGLKVDTPRYEDYQKLLFKSAHHWSKQTKVPFDHASTHAGIKPSRNLSAQKLHFSTTPFVLVGKFGSTGSFT